MCTTAFLIASVYRDVLSIGPADDDIARSALPAFVSAQHTTIRQAFFAAPAFFGSTTASMVPFGNAFLKLWLIVPVPEVLRVVQLLAVMACGVCFVLLVRLITQSFASAYLSLAMLCLSFQIRTAHDGVFGTSLETTVPALCMLLALYAITLSDTGRNRAAFGIGIAFAIAGAFVAAWTLPVVLGFAALRYSKRLVHGSAMTLIPIVSLALARGMNAAASGDVLRLQEDFKHGVYFQHVVYSWFAAIPTAYRAVGNLVRDGISNSNNDVRYINIPHAGLLGWIITLAVAACVYRVARTLRHTNAGARLLSQNGIRIGFLLWLAPAIIGVSANQWRSSLPFGMAYDTVFMSYFGVALLLTLGIRYGMTLIAERGNREAVAIGIAFLAGCTMYGNVRANAAVAQTYMQRDAPRLAAMGAARHGFFSFSQPGDTIALATDYSLPFSSGDYRDARYFIQRIAGREFQVVPARDIEAHGALCRDRRSEVCLPLTGRVSYLRIHTKVPTPPRLDVLAVHWQESRGNTIYGTQAYAYVSKPFPIAKIGEPAVFPAAHYGFNFTEQHFSDGGMLFASQRLCGSVPAESAFRADAPRIVWDDGFYPYRQIPPVEIAGAQEVYDRLYEYHFHARFAQRHARIVVERDRCPATTLRFAIRVFSESPSTLSVRVGDIVQKYTISQAGSDLSIPLPKNLPQRIAIDFSSDSPDASELLLAPRNAHSHAESIALFFAYPKVTMEP